MGTHISKNSTPTFALGPLFFSWGIGFFGGDGRVDGDSFGGSGLGGAELFLKVGGSGLVGLKKDIQKVAAIMIITFNFTCLPLRR